MDLISASYLYTLPLIPSDSAESFDPESFDPELTTEGLMTEGLVEVKLQGISTLNSCILAGRSFMRSLVRGH